MMRSASEYACRKLNKYNMREENANSKYHFHKYLGFFYMNVNTYLFT